MTELDREIPALLLILEKREKVMKTEFLKRQKNGYQVTGVRFKHLKRSEMVKEEY